VSNLTAATAIDVPAQAVATNNDLKEILMKNQDRLLKTITKMVLSGLCAAGIPIVAQIATITRIAPEQGFTVPPGISTPVVLKTLPDAECDLHFAGMNNNSLKLYPNADGYVRLT
jgi:hypothetical protein